MKRPLPETMKQEFNNYITDLLRWRGALKAEPILSPSDMAIHQVNDVLVDLLILQKMSDEMISNDRIVDVTERADAAVKEAMKRFK